MNDDHVTMHAARILAHVQAQAGADADLCLVRRLAERAVWDWWRALPDAEARVASLALRHVRAELDRRASLS